MNRPANNRNVLTKTLTDIVNITTCVDIDAYRCQTTYVYIFVYVCVYIYIYIIAQFFQFAYSQQKVVT